MKSVHWPLMGGLLHLVQRGEAWAGWGLWDLKGYRRSRDMHLHVAADGITAGLY